jgi:nicotinate-nucleotide adenylyltransferase
MSFHNALFVNTKEKNIGILGGTFDPIHYGHIKPALKAAQWLALDEIKLMPAHIPPHKSTTYANAKQRLAMVNLVCQQYPIFSAEPCELLRNSPSFTVDTLELLKKTHKNTRFYFFIGMDSLINFTSWHNYTKILSLCHLVVLSRPSYSLEQVDDLGKQLLNKHLTCTIDETKKVNSGHIIVAPTCHYDISSTQLRAQIKQGIIDKKHLPSTIFEYIMEQKLYSY